MSDEQSSAEKVWTPANIVTMVRICLVPVFVVVIISPWPDYLTFWEGANTAKPWIAALVFIVLAATDGLDGYLARSRNEVTNFGKFVDPLADKILVAAALLALIELGVLPSWPALIILTREFIVSGIRMIAAANGKVIAASWYGKAKTVTQIVAIVLFIVKDSVLFETKFLLAEPLYLVSWAVMLAALVLTIVSMVDYFVKARELLGFGSKKATAGASEADEGGEHAVPESASADAQAALSDEEVAALAAEVLDAARAAGRTLGTAESLTGGLISGALTSVAGSSEVVRGGVTSYAAEVKSLVLGVDAEVIDANGVVSEQTALQMAAGARGVLGCDVAVAVTGIAGPGGAEPGKPVGTVWIACAYPGGECAELHTFAGGRDEVRTRTVYAALDLMKHQLL